MNDRAPDLSHAPVVESVCRAVAGWARGRRDIHGVALVGSWSRDAAVADSDIDLVLLVTEPQDFRPTGDWLQEIDWPSRVASWKDVTYGALWSRHCELEDRTKVELGFSTPEWAACSPIDPGTERVVRDGCRALHDPQGLFERLVRAQQASRQPVNYDRIASCYDRRYDGHRYDGIERALIEFVGGELGCEVLEVGCGTGHWLAFLTAHGARTTGLDPSAGMIGRAREVSRGVALARGRAEELPWRSGSFDRVICINAFHHFDRGACFLAEARRVLRRHGALMSVGLDPHAGVERWWIYDHFPQVLGMDRARYPSAACLLSAMEEAGFARCETREAEHIVRCVGARAAVEQGLLDRSVTSQLMILDDREYQAGVDRIRAADDVVLETDLRLWATIGWVE